MLRLAHHLRMQPRVLLAHRAASTATAHVMSAAKIALAQVPLVDISPLVQERKDATAASPVTAEQKAEILAEMKRACLETGFFTVPTKNVLSNDLINKVLIERTNQRSLLHRSTGV